MPLDYTNPHILRFIIENYDKENEKRVGWFMRNKDKIVDAATFGPNFKDYRVEDISRTSLDLSLPALASQHVESFMKRRTKPMKEALTVRTSSSKRPIRTSNVPEKMIMDLKADSVMRPIEEEVVKLFYEGIPYGGCREYLKARNRKSPEDKYYLDQTNNHVIGWQLKEGANMNQPAQHGRHCILTQELNNRTGPQPDPRYYQQPLVDPYVKCINT